MGDPELGGDITNLVSSLGGHAEHLSPADLNEEDEPPWLVNINSHFYKEEIHKVPRVMKGLVSQAPLSLVHPSVLTSSLGRSNNPSRREKRGGRGGMVWQAGPCNPRDKMRTEES